MSDDLLEALLADGGHHVYYAAGLLHAPPPGVRAARPLEPGLANPVRVARRGAEERHHAVVAMLGARWHRDVAAPAQLLLDPREAAAQGVPNNQASALCIGLATGERVTKLVVGHARPGARPGAHLIYTHVSRDPGRAAALVDDPGLLLRLLPRVLEGQGESFDLDGLSLTRPLHHAHPSDLVSDAGLQRAFARSRPDLLQRLEGAARAVSALQQAAVAHLALLQGARATQRMQATSAFDERRSLSRRESEVEAERAALSRERAVTAAALADLDSRDAALREAARRQLGEELARARDEREAARADAAERRRQAEALVEQMAAAQRERARLEAALGERDVALAEAEEIVQELHRQLAQLSGRGEAS
ncbi:MAG: hypothetical protein KF878_13005 [Planctomycetes bacterium]|nr:hypothetical protein [Planctomycetota bacterium]